MFPTDLKSASFQKHQLLHNWKLKLLTSLGLLFFFSSDKKIELCSSSVQIPEMLPSHFPKDTEKKK